MKLFMLYCSYFSVNIKRLVEYKADFVFNLFSVFIWVGTGLFNISIVFTKLTTFNGWSLAEIGLLYGMWSLTFSIYNAFGHGILDIENNIVSGKMDTLLTKPISPLFQLISSRISTMGLGFLIFGIVIMAISAQKVGLSWNILTISYLIITAVTGGLLIFATYLILGCLAFWFIRSNSAIRIGYDIHKFAQYPIDIYGTGIKIILATILPYAFTNYFPISFLLGKVNVFYGIISPIICLFVFGISILVWTLGLKKYEGSGS